MTLLMTLTVTGCLLRALKGLQPHVDVMAKDLNHELALPTAVLAGVILGLLAGIWVQYFLG